MSKWFDNQDANFKQDFAVFLKKRQDQMDVRDEVAAIIAQVKAQGDEALIKGAKQYDGVSLSLNQLYLSKDEMEAIARKCPPEISNALDHAAQRIESWHKKQMPQNIHHNEEIGVSIEQRWGALDSVGLYIPGGSASYPSSVLMNALPAKIAGVKRIVAATPAQNSDNPLLIKALLRGEVSEVWRMGGAFAIAALAYGTDKITQVDKIVGPGNALCFRSQTADFWRLRY